MADSSIANQLFYNRLADEEKTRLASYALAWQYYHGDHRPQIRAKPGQPNDNISINLYQYLVDKSVSFLFGKELNWQLENGSEAQAEYLAQVWRANRKMSLLQNSALNGSVCGHPFLQIAPLDGGLPRLINLDPAIVRPVWNPDDLTQVLWYKIEYEAFDPKRGQLFKKQMIVRDESGASWTITNYEARDRSQYQQVGDVVAWPFDFAPIVDWQNLPAPNEYFGRPDIEHVDAQDGINFVASDVRRILRFHGHPKTVGSGFQANDVNIGPDEMILLRSAEAKVTNLEMQSDLTSARNFFNDLIDLFMLTQRVPNLLPSKVSVGALSGFALRILYGDLIELNETKRRLYGDAIIETNRRLQIIGGFEPRETTALHWQDPLPENKSEHANELDVELNKLGTVSKETAATELGRDWATEQERLAQQQAQSTNLGSVLLQAFSKGQGVGQ